MMDHKGFYITPFRRDTDSSIDIDDHIDIFGTSINWCPQQYRFGEYNEVDFTAWSFSNSSDYVTGCLKGTKTTLYGIWVVQWKTNTWTLVTPCQKDSAMLDPALHLYDVAPLRQPKQRVHRMDPGILKPAIGAFPTSKAIILERSIRGLGIYSISGRLLWRYCRVDTQHATAVDLPEELNKFGLLLIRFDQDLSY